MGLGKSLRKAWKKTFGWADNEAVKTATIVGVGGALTGGLAAGLTGGMSILGGAGIGAAAGGTVGGLTGYQTIQQEKALDAQIASSEKIAQMQNNTVISAAPVPTQAVQTEAINEQNNATKKARAFRLANSVRGGTLGGGNSNKKITLG